MELLVVMSIIAILMTIGTGMIEAGNRAKLSVKVAQAKHNQAINKGLNEIDKDERASEATYDASVVPAPITASAANAPQPRAAVAAQPAPQPVYYGQSIPVQDGSYNPELRAYVDKLLADNPPVANPNTTATVEGTWQ